MKTCPVCKAIAFDDADTCFGCMYSYADDKANIGSRHLKDERAEPRSEKNKATPMEPLKQDALVVPYEDELAFSAAVAEVPPDYIPLDEMRAIASNTTTGTDSASGKEPSSTEQGAKLDAETLSGETKGAKAMNPVSGVTASGTLPLTFKLSLTPIVHQTGAHEWTCAVEVVQQTLDDRP